jgi:hypothetical protein
MSILKLAEAGEETTLDLAAAEIVEGNFGKQVKFVDKQGDVLFVPLSSVERQLDRCGVADVSDLAGRAIHFSRAPSNKPGGKPYWNMDKARNGDAKKPAKQAVEPYESPARLPGEEPLETGGPPAGYDTTSGYDALVEKYGECIDSVAELLNFRKRVVDGQAFSAMVATLFIARRQDKV